jgi:putative ABC transport system substrate-binding protein
MGKRLQLLRELVPTLARVGLLSAPPEHSSRWLDRLVAELEPAARPLSVQILRFAVQTADDLDRVYTEMKEQSVQGIIVPLSQFGLTNAERLARLTVRHRIPDVHELVANVEAGSLVAYGHNLKELFRQSARFVDRILKGAKPGDLPVEQPTQFDLAINLRTAKALGLTVPQSVLVRANRVIQ